MRRAPLCAWLVAAALAIASVGPAVVLATPGDQFTNACPNPPSSIAFSTTTLSAGVHETYGPVHITSVSCAPNEQMVFSALAIVDNAYTGDGVTAVTRIQIAAGARQVYESPNLGVCMYNSPVYGAVGESISLYLQLILMSGADAHPTDTGKRSYQVRYATDYKCVKPAAAVAHGFVAAADNSHPIVLAADSSATTTRTRSAGFIGVIVGASVGGAVVCVALVVGVVLVFNRRRAPAAATESSLKEPLLSADAEQGTAQ